MALVSLLFARVSFYGSRLWEHICCMNRGSSRYRGDDEPEDPGAHVSSITLTVGSPSAHVDRAPLQPSAATSWAARLPAIGDVIAGKYRIDAHLGSGGVGVVFQATHVITNKALAIKWMPGWAHHPQLMGRFLREARAAGSIDHPNVVDVYDVGELDGSVFMVMELLRGESLRARMQRAPLLEPHEAVELLLSAMRGVHAAHHAGVIHRDLKPENVFVCEPNGEAKVIDFGISRISLLDEPALTRDGAVLGTPAYMSPEQLQAPRDVDERGDVYAFGVILYEILAGHLPFEAASYESLILAIAHASPRPLHEARAGLPRGLCAVVMRALSKDRAQRPANLAQLMAALEPYAAPPRPQPEAASVPASTHRRGLMAVTLIGLAVALGSWLFMSQRTPHADDAKTAPPSAAIVRPAPTPPPAEPTAIVPSSEPMAAEPTPELAPKVSSVVQPPPRARDAPACESDACRPPPTAAAPGRATHPKPSPTELAPPRARSGTISLDEL